MYQFSLEKVNRLYCYVIEREKHKSKDLEDQFIQYMVDTITKYIFQQCSRSVFEEHKLIFSFFISSRIGMKEKNILTAEYMFMLTGS